MRLSLASIGLFVLLSACAAVPSAAPTAALQDPQQPTVVPGPPPAPEMNGQLRLLLGMGQLDEDEWAPTEEPILFGGEFVYQGRDSWLGFEFGTRLAGDYEEVNNVDLSLFVSELYAGPAMLFMRGSPVQPYIGAGVSLVLVYADAESGFVAVEDDDVSFGFYAHAGLAFKVGQFLMGVDARILTGTDLDMFGTSTDVDGEQYSLFFGFGS